MIVLYGPYAPQGGCTGRPSGVCFRTPPRGELVYVPGIITLHSYIVAARAHTVAASHLHHACYSPLGVGACIYVRAQHDTRLTLDPARQAESGSTPGYCFYRSPPGHPAAGH
jgi:hypothetical protein